MPDLSGCWPDDYPPGHTERGDHTHWDVSGVLPVPRRGSPVWVCPVCGGRTVLKDLKLHSRGHVGSANPRRCDVRVKCVGCSLVLTFGVIVPEEKWDQRLAGKWIHWRKVRELLEA